MQHIRIIFINSNRVLLSWHGFCSIQLKKVSIAQYRSYKFLYQDQVRVKVYGVGVNESAVPPKEWWIYEFSARNLMKKTSLIV